MGDRDAIRRWVETWKKAGPELEAIRRKEIEKLNTQETLAALEGAFNHALRMLPPRPDCGLVELHEWLTKLGR